MSAEKIELLIAMAERLTEAFEADIAALKAGNPQAMRSLDPEIQRLTATYGREAASFDPKRPGPVELRKRLVAATGKFKDALQLHARLITRLRNASEGIVKAVADEVEKKRTPLTSYAPGAYRPAKNAIVYNSVI